MPNFYYVFGVEACGTRMLTQAILEATGCYGECSHEQAILQDNKTLVLPKVPQDVILRTSVYHAQKLPPIKKYLDQARGKGYRAWPIWLRRSPKRHNYPGYSERIQFIFKQLTNEPDFTYVQYEAFATSPEYRKWFFDDVLKLKEWELEMEFKNANEAKGFKY